MSSTISLRRSHRLASVSAREWPSSLVRTRAKSPGRNLASRHASSSSKTAWPLGRLRAVERREERLVQPQHGVAPLERVLPHGPDDGIQRGKLGPHGADDLRAHLLRLPRLSVREVAAAAPHVVDALERHLAAERPAVVAPRGVRPRVLRRPQHGGDGAQVPGERDGEREQFADHVQHHRPRRGAARVAAGEQDARHARDPRLGAGVAQVALQHVAQQLRLARVPDKEVHGLHSAARGAVHPPARLFRLGHDGAGREKEAAQHVALRRRRPVCRDEHLRHPAPAGQPLHLQSQGEHRPRDGIALRREEDADGLAAAHAERLLLPFLDLAVVQRLHALLEDGLGGFQRVAPRVHAAPELRLPQGAHGADSLGVQLRLGQRRQSHDAGQVVRGLRFRAAVVKEGARGAARAQVPGDVRGSGGCHTRQVRAQELLHVVPVRRQREPPGSPRAARP